VGDSEYFQFKNETISILRLSNFLPISQEPFEETECCLVRPSTIDYPIGILTGPDVTIAEVSATFEARIDDKNGVIGTFSHDDHLVMLLDLYTVFENHAPDKLRSEPVISGEANILVVEDSMFFRKLIAQYASHDHWKMTIVNDGVEAWKLLRDKQQHFDLIISDINMPRMDGFELVSRIRKDQRFDETPVIALTTLSQDSYRKKGLDLGFDRYVVKINKHEIVQTISDCLQIRRGVSVE
jgi:two-component system chemotaxis sensor kinase CheA